MSKDNQQLEKALYTALIDNCTDSDFENGELTALRRLSGGANMETWSFDWRSGNAQTIIPLIMRRLPGNVQPQSDGGSIGLDVEAALLDVAYRKDVLVPRVVYVLQSTDGLGTGYIMQRINGEALPFKLMSDKRFAKARERFAFDAGLQLARIHSIPLADLPASLDDHSGDALIHHLRKLLDKSVVASPVHELAFQWLKKNQYQSGRKVLVHGDYRNGNLLLDEESITAVLDWELAHIGDPVQDLGYLCSNVWRFNSPLPVGGLGDYESLLDGYESVANWRPSIKEIKYWEVYGALLWGLTCSIMLSLYRSGKDTSIERAAVGRRITESEIDILLLIEDSVGDEVAPGKKSLIPDRDAVADTTTKAEMIDAIRNLLRSEIAPTLEGFNNYQLKIAMNMLSILQRDLQAEPQLAALDSAIAQKLSLVESTPVKQQIVDKLRENRINVDAELLGYLKQRALLEMEVNGPKYSSLNQAKDRWLAK